MPAANKLSGSMLRFVCQVFSELEPSWCGLDLNLLTDLNEPKIHVFMLHMGLRLQINSYYVDI